MTRLGRRWVPALAALALITLLALTASSALGTDRLGGKVRFGETITVPSSETVDHDLYIFAGTIVVDGTVKGDLVAFGGQVTINGPVSGELLVSGGDVSVNGPVTGNLRGSGGQVHINGAVTFIYYAIPSGNGGEMLFEVTTLTGCKYNVTAKDQVEPGSKPPYDYLTVQYVFGACPAESTGGAQPLNSGNIQWHNQ